MPSCFGNNIRVTIFGQSHAKGVGVVLDGLPAGFAINMEEIRAFLARRAPGNSPLSTSRQESDAFSVLSGLSRGKTCGAPLCAVIYNADAHPGDYAALSDTPRPGHADYPAHVKFGGHQDAAGGGHFSGRLTAPLCFAGAVALQMLSRRGVRIKAHIIRVGAVRGCRFDPVDPELDALCDAPLRALSPDVARRMADEIAAAKAAGDSVGGEIECAIVGLKAGVGAPMFDGLENAIARAVFAIPGVKGVDFGAGFGAAAMRGSAHNDAFCVENGRVITQTNHAGGILGGLSTGMPVIFRAVVKPPSSIALVQNTVSLLRMENTTVAVSGRHDPCIAPRAVPCVEAVAALAVLDLLLDAPPVWRGDEGSGENG